MFLAQRALALTFACTLALGTVATLDNDAFSTVLGILHNKTKADRTAELDAQLARTRNIRAEKKATAEKVIAGDMTVAEAAAKFQALHADDELYLTHLQRLFPDAPECQLVTLDVMAEVEFQIDNNEPRAAMQPDLTSELPLSVVEVAKTAPSHD